MWDVRLWDVRRHRDGVAAGKGIKCPDARSRFKACRDVSPILDSHIYLWLKDVGSKFSPHIYFCWRMSGEKFPTYCLPHTPSECVNSGWGLTGWVSSRLRGNGRKIALVDFVGKKESTPWFTAPEGAAGGRELTVNSCLTSHNLTSHI